MTNEFTVQQWERYEGDDWWKWAVWIEASDEALDRIDFVEWVLDPSFPNPIRKTNDRTSKFRIETGGWGVFAIVARIQLKNGEQIRLRHYLRLQEPDEEVLDASGKAKRVKKVWVCQTDRGHVFDEPTEDGFCPKAPPFHGILLLEREAVGVVKPGLNITITFPDNGQEFDEGTNITISADPYVPNDNMSKVEFFVDEDKIGEDISTPCSFIYSAVRGKHTITAKVWDNKGTSVTSPPVKINVRTNPVPEVGLSVILMDASASMTDPVFRGSPITRMRLVATTAASAIFDLERMQGNSYALVAAFKFDDRLELIFMDTIANLINRFNRDVTTFANYIYDELFKMQQGTDINQALMHAHSFVDKFLRRQLPDFPLKNYGVMMQRILKYNSAESVSIANVRVLIYTDGMQYDAHGGRILRPNPFKQYPLPGLNHDIVIGAFLGQENDEGAKELQSLLSRCPIHDEPQFFLFDSPAKIGNLKYLFRMASGASGFCRKCLEKELYR